MTIAGAEKNKNVGTMGNQKPQQDHELYFGSFMLAMGVLGVLWRLFLDFPSILILGAGAFIIANDFYRRVATRGLEYYFPTLYNILYRESLFDLAFNQNHVTRFLRMMSRFVAIVTLRDLSDESTRELLDGMDDSFINRLFSPGVLSMVAPDEKNSFPIDREVAMSIIKERRINPFTRPDMPYPVGVTAKRLLTPYLAGSLQSASLATSAVMWKYYNADPRLSLIPASAGTLLGLVMLIRSKVARAPHFQKHYPQFAFRPLVGRVDPLTIGLICKYRKFYH
jgi:hypothetical protein